jgi:hypothetical protein
VSTAHGTGPVLEYHQPFILVGGHPRADLRLEDPGVSQRHLYLQVIDGHLFGVQLSGRVPTQWGNQSKQAGWVPSDCVLRLGSFSIRNLGSGKLSTTAGKSLGDPMAAGSYPGAPYTLHLAGAEAAAGNEIALDRKLTLVGNLPICKVRMNSSHASGVHCSLIRARDGVWIHDMCSREGLRVNNVQVETALLHDGENLEIGNRVFRIRYAARLDDEPSPPDTKPSAESSLLPVRRELSIEPTASAVGLAEKEVVEEILGPVLDRMADFQSQTFEQFQELMATMVRMFGAMLSEHREFVKEERERFEQIAHGIAASQFGAQRAVDPVPAARSETEAERPRPTISADVRTPPFPPQKRAPNHEQIHLWLEERMSELSSKRANFWQKLFGLVRNTAPVNQRD